MSRVSLQTLIDRSVRNMGAVHEVVKLSAIEMIKRAYAEGINVQISSGYRSYAEQTKLYNQGRTTPGNIVTNARAGYSNHNFGVAIDYFLTNHDGSKAVWTVNAQWRRVAAIGKQLGFSWGGDWTSFKDYPHLEMTGGLTTAQMRAGQRPNLKINFTPTKVENVETETGGTQVTEPKPKPKPKPSGDPFIRSVQTWSCNYGYDITVDGLKGPETRKALVKILQNELNKQFKAALIVDGVPGPKTYAAVVNVRKGAKGNLTRVLQALLYMAGQNPGPFDGHFGNGTEKAVRAFQRAKGLGVDGVAGKNTWKALLQ
ncbi:peptidoglycan-binding protein [Shouchella clausii]|uniref:peptidoglycan-binding protein n=1 Tax=Shouchella clausii TaxID=79880 RepID=UPI00289965C2|nr:peptidoglycan-binding protein [Shouchella clausii]